MSCIRPTAAAQHGDRRQLVSQRNVPGGKVVWITLVEFGRFVEFGMAPCGGVGTHSEQPVTPRPALVERDLHGQLSLLRQNGWEIHYLRYADTQPDSLPTRMQLKHNGMELQLLIDEWDTP